MSKADGWKMNDIGDVQEGTSVGNDVTRIAFDDVDGHRKGVLFYNGSALRQWVKFSKLISGETVTEESCDFNVPAKDTVFLPVGERIQLWVKNSSGAATTAAFRATEVQ